MTDDLMAAIIKHGLESNDIRQAILEYIKVATQEKRSQPEWQKVYTRQSDTSRLWQGEGPDPITGAEPYVVEVFLYMDVHYHAGEQIGKIVAYMDSHRGSHEYLFNDISHWSVSSDFIILENGFTAKDASSMIDKAIDHWPECERLFLERTSEQVAVNDA